MKKQTKIFIAIIVAVIVAAAIGTGIYADDYYRAADVEDYVTSSGSVTVSEIEEGYFCDGPAEDKALIFYPGAKVEETAYAPIMKTLAENGVDCFLVRMPLKLAILGMNRADGIVGRYNYDSYYLAGHSLGGAMAANYAAKHKADYAGLFLLAAYPTGDLTSAKFPVVFIYGENDGVLNREKLKAGFNLAPGDYREVVIDGGNHAQFGSYGEQKGDGAATIPAEEQQKITADTILETVNK